LFNVKLLGHSALVNFCRVLQIIIWGSAAVVVNLVVLLVLVACVVILLPLSETRNTNK